MDVIDSDNEIILYLCNNTRLEKLINEVCDLENGGRIDCRKIGCFLKILRSNIENNESSILSKLKVCQRGRVLNNIHNVGRKFFLNKYKNVP